MGEKHAEGVAEHDDLRRQSSISKPPAGEVKEIQGDAHFHETVSAAPLNPWSKTSFQLYGILFVAAMNAVASGFDGSIFSSINAMDAYKRYFHNTELGNSTGIIFMIYTIGNMIGSLFTGPICDRFGRRAGMITGSILIMIGAIVQTAARSDAYLLGGRFTLGFGVSIGTSSAPTYALELAPPQWRARVVGYYNTFFYAGSILATGVAYASNKNQTELAFRLPLGLQLFPPLIIIIGALMIPESPRWLTMWGKKEQAAEILAKYHGGGDMNHPMVQLELREFEASIELQSASSIFDYYALVKGHNARWRFLVMTFMSIFAQMAGNSVLTYYLPSMYTLLGIVDTDKRLLLTFMNSIVSCAGAIAGSATNDRIGRRTKLWVGSLVLAGLFAGVTGFSSKFEGAAKLKAAGTPLVVSSAYSNGGVAFIFLFGCAYSFIYTPLTATYCAEVLATPSRAKGMGIHVILSNIANLYNTYVTPIALRSIDWRYYLLFVGLNVIYSGVWFFFGVETRGRTLEEMDKVFDAKWPPRAALQKATMVKLEDGHMANVGSTSDEERGE